MLWMVFVVLCIAFLTLMTSKVHSQFVTFVTPTEDSYKFAVNDECGLDGACKSFGCD